MNKQTAKPSLIGYELKNLLGNWYIPFFGMIFPIFMCILICKGALREVPVEYYQDAVTGICIGFMQLIPLASVFLGVSSINSQEFEKKIPLRMELFGFSSRQLLFSRMIAMTLFMLIAIGVHLTSLYFILDYKLPTVGGGFATIGLIFLEAAILFALAYGIANFIRRFGPTYAISMILYFGFMILGGMMGIPADSFPGPVKAISNLLPFTYFASSDFTNVWLGKPYAFGPMMQAMLFLGGLSLLVLFGSIIYRKNKAF